ncbi:hypothetical protein [Cellulomonas sp. ATA003]|uniref:hypothetical protein n=1 Tax=Cellulomonas sp. ATA003 TaxID=3073064 RepID=UPI0028734B74|nr:hypothetical protein [Cellulomonas sp. ATA003]WNB84523.1 hypothetical protein REH70_11850 [Cellulomonas sp. ATA003]
MNRDELLALPVTVDVETAGRALSIGRTKAFQLAKAGQFPARVLRLGGKYRVVTADLLELLGVAPTRSDGASATDAPIAPTVEDFGGPRLEQHPTQLHALSAS